MKAKIPDLFMRTLNSLRFGQTAEELSEHVRKCVEAARDTGKQSELTIKLKFKPEARGSQIFIIDEIKAKIPEFAREATILFPTPEGNLVRNDPRQEELPGLTRVETEKPSNFKVAQ